MKDIVDLVSDMPEEERRIAEICLSSISSDDSKF